MSARIVILFIFLFGKAAYSQSLEQANLLMMQENFTEAKLLLNDIIKADSTNVKALYKLGLCCLAGNDYISAINALEFVY